jgi:transmembrane sensor
MNYTTVEEILTDDSFLAWHYQSDAAATDKWRKWVKANPAHQRMADKAIQLLRLIRLAEEKSRLTERQITASLVRVRNGMVNFEKQHGNGS